jgi:acetoin:2,6-dichlorophenolindophenol oxidoreductase subunit alpha
MAYQMRRKTMPSDRLWKDTDLYRAMCRIRYFEETVLENFARGIFFGTTHTYLGQEADAVGVISHLSEQDIVISNHRCHGHFLAYGGDMRALFAELMGKSTGVCGGRGGSQHIHWKNFYSNGVQGGVAPLAVGMALAEKIKGNHAVALGFMGDGTFGEGVIYEALNMAALWKTPVLFIVENNHIAQTTPVELAVAGSLVKRFEAFGIPALELDTSDVREIMKVSDELLTQVRSLQTPRAMILHTCRFGPHSKGDDTRPAAEVAAMRASRDPLMILGSVISPGKRSELEARAHEEVLQAFGLASSDPFPEPSSLFR